MQSFAILTLLAAAAFAAPAPQSAALVPSGSITTWQNNACSDNDGSRNNLQNLPDQECRSLGGFSLQVDFLRQTSCEFRVYTSSTSCDGTPAAVFKPSSVCHDTTNFHAYKIVC
ncbi:hypothetical protein CC86DRAFT_367888 [Ophiobolus disseminans]|uniref:Uncharacterized protein n=1 Tax=Ophiobolus disseminans TaxID=1469910 RepID=A0A6A7ABN2_9PLEO|nr:hypothetical protein CC86DRAFT_367888 [Ophiobolus disseminans]